MNLEQRIQRLEDIEAIKQLKARYLHACDRKQLDAIRDCFHPHEVSINYGAIGQFTDRDAFVSVYEQMACNNHIIDMHHGQNPQIQWLSNSTAQGVWDLYFFQINTKDDLQTQLAGFYEDQYIKHEEQWYIAATRFEITSSLITQGSSTGLNVFFAGQQATF